MEPYDQEAAQTMRRFHDSLSEKDQRRYAGIEALRYGRGGRRYIARVLGCSRRTVSRGATEVSQLSTGDVDQHIRQPGAGRKTYQERWPEIERQSRVLSKICPLSTTISYLRGIIGLFRLCPAMGKSFNYHSYGLGAKPLLVGEPARSADGSEEGPRALHRSGRTLEGRRTSGALD